MRCVYVCVFLLSAQAAFLAFTGTECIRSGVGLCVWLLLWAGGGGGVSGWGGGGGGTR